MTDTVTICDCGHPPTPQKPGSCGTGYGRDSAGKTACYACCAAKDRADMIETGRATLYLVSRPNPSPATVGSDMNARAERHWFVVNWPGSLEFKCFPRIVHSPNGGGFGAQRTDAWFPGPDGFVWHAINRGDNDIARCKRTKEKL